jgi:hypothetical protein
LALFPVVALRASRLRLVLFGKKALAS